MGIRTAPPPPPPQQRWSSAHQNVRMMIPNTRYLCGKVATTIQRNQADYYEDNNKNLNPDINTLTKGLPHHLRPQVCLYHQSEVHLDHPLGRDERRWAAAGSSHPVPSLALVTPIRACVALDESRGRVVAYWTSWLRLLSPPLRGTREE